MFSGVIFPLNYSELSLKIIRPSSLLFGGLIPSFYRGPIFFSYKFFDKDTFLSEIPPPKVMRQKIKHDY